MENVTDLIAQGTDAYNSVTAWFAVAVAFVTGLFADFRGYSRTKKIWVVAGGILALIALLTVAQALFG